MRYRILPFFSLLSPLVLAEDKAHGEGDLGSSMGPVAFLWPADRHWTADADNRAPCGSSYGVTNRTEYPLTQGSVALTVADDAWNVVFRIAYKEDPKVQADFTQQIVSTVADVDEGHLCYKIGAIPQSVKAGSNATIQMEYWAEYEGENNGEQQSFFACADITFIEPQSFTTQPPCFNVTSSDFTETPPSSTATSTPKKTPASTPINTPNELATGANPLPSSSSSNDSDRGLSTGAKAGIAVGAIVGGLAIIGLAGMWWIKRRRLERARRQAYHLSQRKVGGEE